MNLYLCDCSHGEQLGDHYLSGKQGFFESSYHIPMIIRDPRPQAAGQYGTVVDQFSEHVDVLPTIMEWLGADVPIQCDGFSLLPFLQPGAARDVPPPGWRNEAHWEYDWRDVSIDAAEGGHRPEAEQRLGLTMHQCGLMVSRSKRWKYVHFTNLPPLLYDLTVDPHEQNNLAN
eukprot:COSAG02_NODE_13767_length_1351_cov_1.412141_1_plen_172_part_10